MKFKQLRKEQIYYNSNAHTMGGIGYYICWAVHKGRSANGRDNQAFFFRIHNGVITNEFYYIWGGQHSNLEPYDHLLTEAELKEQLASHEYFAMREAIKKQKPVVKAAQSQYNKELTKLNTMKNKIESLETINQYVG